MGELGADIAVGSRQSEHLEQGTADLRHDVDAVTQAGDHAQVVGDHGLARRVPPQVRRIFVL